MAVIPIYEFGTLHPVAYVDDEDAWYDGLHMVNEGMTYLHTWVMTGEMNGNLYLRMKADYYDRTR